MNQSQKKYRTIFFGTPDFSLPTLEKILTLPYLDLRLVVSQPDKPVGRKQTITASPVKLAAEQHRIPVILPEKIKTHEFEERVKAERPDLAIVIAYGKIIPANILAIPEHGFLNLHASLLPRWRGASPIQHTILSGDSVSGVTLMKIDESMDTGPIIAQETALVTRNERFDTLHDLLAKKSARLLERALLPYLEGKLKPTPQDKDKATYTKIIKKEDGKIDWSTSAIEIERKIRAFTPWPGAWTLWHRHDTNAMLKITRASVLNPHISCADNTLLGKTFLTTDNKLAVTCGKGSLIFERLQLEGKKEMDSADFLKGRPEIGKAKLE